MWDVLKKCKLFPPVMINNVYVMQMKLNQCKVCKNYLCGIFTEKYFHGKKYWNWISLNVYIL